MARSNFNLNTAALVTQFIAICLLFIGIIVPQWLANPAGLNYYPYSRTWGLLTVVGRRTQTHGHIWDLACKVSRQMSVGVVCTSPLCKWYAQKCAAYHFVLIASYTTLGMVLGGIVLGASSMVFSLRRTKKALRFSTGLALLSCAITFSSTIIYVFIMGTAFSMINSAGHYPTPQPSVSFILVCVASFLMAVSCILHYVRFRQLAREVDYILEAKYEQHRVRQELGV